MTGFRKPDRGEMLRFVQAMFPNATPGTFVPLRAYVEGAEKQPWRPELWSWQVIGNDLRTLANAASDLACGVPAADRDGTAWLPLPPGTLVRLPAMLPHAFANRAAFAPNRARRFAAATSATWAMRGLNAGRPLAA